MKNFLKTVLRANLIKKQLSQLDQTNKNTYRKLGRLANWIWAKSVENGLEKAVHGGEPVDNQRSVLNQVKIYRNALAGKQLIDGQQLEDLQWTVADGETDNEPDENA